MSVKVAAWNVRDGLGDPSAAKKVLENIKRLNADLLVLPEAYAEDAQHGDVLKESQRSLEQDGYDVLKDLYNDNDGRLDKHGLMLASRLGASAMSMVYMGQRTALRMWVEDPATRTPMMFYGTHLDDRHEEIRMIQAQDLVMAHFGNQHSAQDAEADPLVLAGDLNAMHGRDRLARLLRMTYPFTRPLPSVNPGERAESWHFLKHKISLAQRLGGMATGEVMYYLTEYVGLQDADPNHTATKGPVQLDHILYTPKSLAVSDFEVHDRVTSDHRPITAVIHT